jgi:hypothetical protein
MSELPAYDEAIKCPVCERLGYDPSRGPYNVMTGMHGVFGGGGYGKYTMCENCGLVLSKTSDDEVSDVTGDKS